MTTFSYFRVQRKNQTHTVEPHHVIGTSVFRVSPFQLPKPPGFQVKYTLKGNLVLVK